MLLLLTLDLTQDTHYLNIHYKLLPQKCFKIGFRDMQYATGSGKAATYSQG